MNFHVFDATLACITNRWRDPNRQWTRFKPLKGVGRAMRGYLSGVSASKFDMRGILDTQDPTE
jgi:hypothetical protein